VSLYFANGASEEIRCKRPPRFEFGEQYL